MNRDITQIRLGYISTKFGNWYLRYKVAHNDYLYEYNVKNKNKN